MKKKNKGSARKQARQKHHAQEEVFYVGVPTPADVRRTLLECSREAVQFLQRYEKLKAIRQEKMQAVQQLRSDVRELRSLMSNAKKLLPKTHLKIKLSEAIQTEVFACDTCGASLKNKGALTRHMHHHQELDARKAKEEAAVAVREAKQRADEQKKQEQKPVEKPKPMTELEKLESELSEIEGKLGELS